MGRVPEQLLSGVPAHVDGRMIGITESAGAHVINSDRMWHYTEGITNYDPIWPLHGIRILPGPSSLWLDATGKRLPPPLYPGFDTLGTLEYIAQTGQDYTWFVLNARIIDKEFGLSGQEQNPDLTGAQRAPGAVAGQAGRAAAGAGVRRQGRRLRHRKLVARPGVQDERRARRAAARLRHGGGRGDRARPRGGQQVHQGQPDHRDPRWRATTCGDRVSRVVAPHRLTDPKAGPLIAVKLHILTRKSLGGLETDLDSRVLKADGSVFDGLYAAGEAAGFGGGGVHGYRSLEGTFLGGCVFSGRAAGRAAARDVG